MKVDSVLLDKRILQLPGFIKNTCTTRMNELAPSKRMSKIPQHAPVITKFSMLAALLLSLFSCVDEDKDDPAIKQQEGEIWRSGGLAVCAEQIHLANGDTLIVDLEDIMDFSAGDRVNVKYTERGLNEACAPGINGEIIEIRKME